MELQLIHELIVELGKRHLGENYSFSSFALDSTLHNTSGFKTKYSISIFYKEPKVAYDKAISYSGENLDEVFSVIDIKLKYFNKPSIITIDKEV